MTDWSELHHAYGTAEDVPGLLDAARPAPQDPSWDELWSRLCHQGTVYSASCAALPALRDMARHWSPRDRRMPLCLAGSTVAGKDQPYGVQDPQVTYASETSDLVGLTEEALEDPGLADTPTTYVHLLAALLSFEGVDVWGERLDGLNDEEYEVSCPTCSTENFIAFGAYGFFSTVDSMYMKATTARKVPLQPHALSPGGARPKTPQPRPRGRPVRRRTQVDLRLRQRAVRRVRCGLRRRGGRRRLLGLMAAAACNTAC